MSIEVKTIYPRIVRAECRVEVPARDRKGRPYYRWVGGWVVQYQEGRESLPMRYREAQATLRQAKQSTLSDD